MAELLKTHPYYRPAEVEAFFGERGWGVEFVKVSNVDLVEAEEGLAVECIDGRFGKLQQKKKHGPKLPGGSYSVAALKTGGNIVGFNEAASLLKKLGYRAGTHELCGFFELWMQGGLTAVQHKLELPRGVDHKNWVIRKHKQWEGVHFGISEKHEKHEEEALIFNPFLGFTPQARKDRFGYDHGLMQLLGIHGRRGMHLVAETVEKLSPHRKVEILTK